MPEKCPLWFRPVEFWWRVDFPITGTTAWSGPPKARRLGLQCSMIFFSFLFTFLWHSIFYLREASGSSGLLFPYNFLLKTIRKLLRKPTGPLASFFSTGFLEFPVHFLHFLWYNWVFLWFFSILIWKWMFLTLRAPRGSSEGMRRVCADTRL